MKNGKYSHDHWLMFARNPTVDFKPKLWIEGVSEEELLSLLNKAYNDFYLRPSYVMKEILKINSFDELKRKMQAGFYLFKDRYRMAGKKGD